MLSSANLWLLATVFVCADVMPRMCGCGSPRMEHVPGTATITAIQPPADGDKNCEVESIRVVFDFVESGKKAPSDEYEKAQRILMGSELNPPRAFIERKGIQVGQTYSAMKEMYPVPGDVRYVFPTLEMSDAVEECYKNTLNSAK